MSDTRFKPKQSKADESELPTEVIVGALAANSSSDDLLKQFLVDELAQRAKKRKQEEDDLRRLIDARTQGFKEEIARRELGQQICNHRKENQRPNIGGQRLSNGHTVFICGTCYKTWDDALPPNLQIGMESIGG